MIRFNLTQFYRILLGYFRHPLFHLSFIFAANFIFVYRYLEKYWNSSYVNGWDGTSHFAVLSYFTEHIFPNTFGWIFNWNQGMPWSNGYPPLYSYFFAVLFKLFPGITPIDIFKGFFILLALLLPILVYFIATKLQRSSLLALATAGWAIFLLNTYHVNITVLLGNTMSSMFQVGLYPQSLSILILLIWLVPLFAKRKSYTPWLSGVMLALILLTNLHVAQAALLLFVVKVLVDLTLQHKRLVILDALITIAVMVGLSSFWIFPLIETSSYMLAASTKNVQFFDLFKYDPYFRSIGIQVTLTLLGGYWAIIKKNATMITIYITCIGLVAISVLPIYKYFPGLPLQPSRLISLAYLLAIFVIPYSISAISWTLNLLLSKYPLKRASLIVSAFVVMSLGLTTAQPAISAVGGGAADITSNELQVVNYLSQFEDGRSVIEVWYRKFDPTQNTGYIDRPLQGTMSGLVSLDNKHETLWGIFRESSVNLPLIQPVRNGISQQHESYATICWLCADDYNDHKEVAKEYYRQEFGNHLARAKQMGVRYFAVHTWDIINLLKGSGFYGKDLEVEHLQTFGEWQIFRFKREVDEVNSVNQDNLVLTFADLKNRERDVNDYDWYRLTEEWLFNANFNYYLVRAKNTDLAKTSDINNFSKILITNYHYSNLADAVDRLKVFASRNEISLLESSDPLYLQLIEAKKADDKLKISTFNNSGNTRADYSEWSKSLSQKLTQPAKINTTEYRLSNDQITLIGDSQADRNAAYSGNASKSKNYQYVRYSYHPWWEVDFNYYFNGAVSEVYMASPAVMLIVSSHSNITLNFKTESSAVIYGKYITTITFGIIITLGLTSYYAKRKKQALPINHKTK